jgi:hypothetical protein
VAYVGVVDIHHHVPKSTTSAGAVPDVRDMRDRRDSKFWPKIPKPRTSDLSPSRGSPVPPVSLGYPGVRAGPNCLWVWR